MFLRLIYKYGICSLKIQLFFSSPKTDHKFVIPVQYKFFVIHKRRQKKGKKIRRKPEILSGGGPCQKSSSDGRKCREVRDHLPYHIIFLSFFQIRGATRRISDKSGQNQSRGWQAPKGGFRIFVFPLSKQNQYCGQFGQS